MLANETNPLLLTSIEAAKRLGIFDADASSEPERLAVNRVHRLRRQGRLRPVKVANRYFFAPSELSRFVAEATESSLGDSASSEGSTDGR